jgi:hypothetical protein
MTVASEISEVEYAGNGVTVAFSIPFGFSSNSDIAVATRDSSGDATAITTGFAITGAGTGSGTCTFTTAPASGITVRIERAPEIVQNTDYTANDAFPAESMESALDERTYVDQYLRTLSKRCLQVPAGDAAIDGSVVLPSVTNRKGKLLYFDDTTGAIDVLALTDVSGVSSPISQGLIGSYLYPRTAAEIAAGVTPTNYAYPPGYVQRYGATVNGVADDTTAITTALSCNDTIYLTGMCGVSQLVLTGSGNSSIFGKAIEGVGPRSGFVGISAGTSIIRFGTSGGWVDETNLQEYRADYCRLKNLIISSTAAYTYGIECQWLTNSEFDVVISGGILIDSAIYIDFSWDNIINVNASAKYGIAQGAHSPNANTYTGRLAGGGLGGVGLVHNGSTATVNMDISAFTSGIKSSGGYGLSVIGGYYESNACDIDLGDGSLSGVSITGCTFLSGTGANVGIRHNGGGGNVRGVAITGNAFRNKIDAIILHANTQAWTVTGNDYLSCTRKVTIAGTNHMIDVDGVLTLVGGSLKFPATQISSADVNTLDDYEEGTFTPEFTGLTTVMGGGSLTMTGTYTKFGRKVSADVTITSTGGATSQSVAGTTFVNNLPFAAVGSTAGVQASDGGLTSHGIGVVQNGSTSAFTPAWAASAVQKYIHIEYQAAT